MTALYPRALVPGLLLLGLLLPALSPSAQAQAVQPRPPDGDYGLEAGPPSIGVHQHPAYAVSAVEATQAGPLTAVRVRDVTSTAGWLESTLVPLVRSVPSDGVLDLVLVAKPPPEAMPASGFATVDAVLLVEANPPYRGVRVRSATNVLALAAMPGRVEAPPAGEDCHGCVGRPLDGAGAVARDTLPRNTRILDPATSFTDVVPDPNRLTLLVGEDGKVIEAMWQ